VVGELREKVKVLEDFCISLGLLPQHDMVVKSIEVGKFSKAIKEGLIMVLYKSRDKSDLEKPHLFLNVMYKIY
jgi:hypothetical protein